jgi:hypothetical protein
MVLGRGFDQHFNLNNLDGQGPLGVGKTKIIKTAKRGQVTPKKFTLTNLVTFKYLPFVGLENGAHQYQLQQGSQTQSNSTSTFLE